VTISDNDGALDLIAGNLGLNISIRLFLKEASLSSYVMIRQKL